MILTTYLFFFGIIMMIIGYYEGQKWHNQNSSKIIYKFIDQLQDETKPPKEDIRNKFTAMFEELPIFY